MPESVRKQSLSPITKSLGFLGLTPFVVSTYLEATKTTLLDYEAKFLFASYSAIILSFLAGTLWGRSIQDDESPEGNLLLVISNGAAIIAWISLLLGIEYFWWTLAFLMFGFAAFMMIEYQSFNMLNSDVDLGYVKMRILLTCLVLAAHLLLILILF